MNFAFGCDAIDDVARKAAPGRKPPRELVDEDGEALLAECARRRQIGLRKRGRDRQLVADEMGEALQPDLLIALDAPELARYARARDTGDFATAVVIAGEAADLVHKVEPAARIVERMVEDAEALLRRGPSCAWA